MTSSQNLSGGKDQPGCLLKASAEQAPASVDALVAVCGGADDARTAQELAYSLTVDRRITDEIRVELDGTWTNCWSGWWTATGRLGI